MPCLIHADNSTRPKSLKYLLASPQYRPGLALSRQRPCADWAPWAFDAPRPELALTRPAPLLAPVATPFPPDPFIPIALPTLYLRDAKVSFPIGGPG